MKLEAHSPLRVPSATVLDAKANRLTEQSFLEEETESSSRASFDHSDGTTSHSGHSSSYSKSKRTYGVEDLDEASLLSVQNLVQVFQASTSFRGELNVGGGSTIKKPSDRSTDRHSSLSEEHGQTMNVPLHYVTTMPLKTRRNTLPTPGSPGSSSEFVSELSANIEPNQDRKLATIDISCSKNQGQRLAIVQEELQRLTETYQKERAEWQAATMELIRVKRERTSILQDGHHRFKQLEQTQTKTEQEVSLQIQSVLQRCNEEKEEMINKNQNLSTELSTWKSKFEVLQQQHFVELKTMQENWQDEKNRAEEQLQVLQRQISTLKMDVEESARARLVLETSHSNLEKALSLCQEDRRRIEERHRELTAHGELWFAEKQKLEQQFLHSQVQLKSLKKETNQFVEASNVLEKLLLGKVQRLLIELVRCKEIGRCLESQHSSLQLQQETWMNEKKVLQGQLMDSLEPIQIVTAEKNEFIEASQVWDSTSRSNTDNQTSEQSLLKELQSKECHLRAVTEELQVAKNAVQRLEQQLDAACRLHDTTTTKQVQALEHSLEQKIQELELLAACQISERDASQAREREHFKEILQLETKLKAAMSKHLSLRIQLDVSQRRILLLENRLDISQGRLNEEQTKNRDAEIAIEELKSQNLSISSRAEDLVKKNVALEEQLMDVTKRSASQSSDYLQGTKEKDALLELSRENLEAMKQQNAVLEKNLSELTDLLKKKTSDFSLSELARARMSESIELFAEKESNLMERVHSLEMELKSAEDLVSSLELLKEEKNILCEEINQLKGENRIILLRERRNVEKMESLKSQLNETQNNLKSALDAKVAEYEIFQSELDTARHEAELCRRQNSEFRKAHQATLLGAREQIAILGRGMNSAPTSAGAKDSDERDRLQKELDLAKLNMRELKQEVSELEDVVQQLKSAAEIRETCLQTKIAEYEIAKTELSYYRARADCMLEDYSELGKNDHSICHCETQQENEGGICLGCNKLQAMLPSFVDLSARLDGSSEMLGSSSTTCEKALSLCQTNESDGEVSQADFLLKSVMKRKKSEKRRWNRWNEMFSSSPVRAETIPKGRIQALEEHNDSLQRTLVKIQNLYRGELYKSRKRVADLEIENQSLLQETSRLNKPPNLKKPEEANYL